VAQTTANQLTIILFESGIGGLRALVKSMMKDTRTWWYRIPRC